MRYSNVNTTGMGRQYDAIFELIGVSSEWNGYCAISNNKFHVFFKLSLLSIYQFILYQQTSRVKAVVTQKRS